MKKNLIQCLLVAISTMMSGCLFAADYLTEVKDYGYNFHEANNINPDLQTMTTDLFGDKIDPASGSVSFEQTDISIPGNSGIPVTITRTLSDPDSWFRETRDFENWSLAIPHVRSTYITDRSGNAKSAYWAIGKACTSRLNSNPHFSEHVTIDGLQATSQEYVANKNSYWNGDTVSIPGYGSVKLTEKDSTYQRYNNRNWKVDCITNSSTGRDGFKVTLDNGLIYYFTEERVVSSAKKFILTPTTNTLPCDNVSVPCVPDSLPASDPVPQVQYPMYHIFMQASRVENRFGQWVEYDYGANGRLEKIRSNDNRTIDINYSGNRISSINALNKTWTYSYDDSGVKTLASVTRPDNKQWTFSHDKTTSWSFWLPINIGKHTQFPDRGTGCTTLSGLDYPLIEITHPEGMRGEFTMNEICHGQTGVARILKPNPMGYSYDSFWLPYASNLFSISKKTLIFSDNSTYTWNYEYSQNEGFYGTGPIQAKHRLAVNLGGFETAYLKSTTITNPDSSKFVQYFDRRKGNSAGNLLFSEVYDSNNNLQKRDTFEYSDGHYHGSPLTAAFVDVSTSQYSAGDLVTGESATRKQRQTKKIEYFSNTLDSYTTTYSGFDIYDYPQTTYESNNFNGKKRYIKSFYYHDTTNWLLGQPSRVEVSSDGINYTEVFKTSYHSASGSYKSLPNYQYEFGRWFKRNESYHTSGTQAGLPKLVRYNGASYNSNSRWMEFSNYKRGKAQTVRTPQSLSTASQYAYLVVNDDGWVTKVTDFENNCTNYGYNPIGRLTLIDPCDSRWLNTNISYTTTTGNDGLSHVFAGMLKQTITRGNYKKSTYFDNLFRPRMTEERDISVTSGKRYVRQNYDAFNRATYQSKPAFNSIFLNHGVTTQYDALGRVTSVDDDTISGSVTYQYLASNKVRVNDNKGNLTTTTYLAYGSPTQTDATYIAAPNSTNTSLNYNIFGNLTSISQGGITESRVYDSYQKLCKTIRPDVGNTALVYNAINEVLWSARGSSISSSTSSCDTSVTAADKVTYSFDNLGNIRTESYSDSSPDKTFTYNKNGQLTNLVAGGVTTSYQYNSAQLLEKETLSVDSKSFVLDYGYDNMGHLSNLIYPSGQNITYSPNALGQPTKAGIYASDAVYHSNGTLQTHLYKNGFRHTLSLYQSGMPSGAFDRKVVTSGGGCVICPVTLNASSSLGSSGDVGINVVIKPGEELLYAFNHSYSYDANNNLTFLDDKVNNAYDFRATYDGLDRLDVIADSYSGTGDVNYDTMGNITYYKIGSKTLNYSYNANKQLSSVSGYQSYSFQYDDKGNVTHNGRRSFNYNTANQMVSLE